MSAFLSAPDLVGTFVFALSGAVAAVRRELDLFGVLVLSFVAASTGGVIRDVLIGAIPPPPLRFRAFCGWSRTRSRHLQARRSW